MPDCVFCAVIAGDVSSHVVYRDDAAIVFLDRSPVFKGHTLVVPTRHVETLPDLEPHEIESYFSLVQKVSAVVPRALESDGTFVAINNVVSQSVAHLHTHVVPRRRKDGLRGFFWPRTKYASDAEAADFAARIREAIGAIPPKSAV
ncbi:MAG TPA: HIT family protein [Ilumatobacteraceae bacterium]|nr:HIT family protein [Ilumatobacteraceae bacterium]